MAKKNAPTFEVKALRIGKLDPTISALLHSFVDHTTWIVLKKSLEQFHSKVIRLQKTTSKYLAYKVELSEGKKPRKVQPPTIPHWLNQSFKEDESLQRKVLSEEAIAALTSAKIRSVRQGHIKYVRESMIE